MRLFSGSTEREESSALYVELSIADARELRGALDDLIADPSGGHYHLSSSDYQSELTVWIEGHP